MISADQLMRMREAAKAVGDDMQADVERWEGSEFTGRNVGEQFGEIRAAVFALARMLDKLLAEVEPS